MSAGRVSYPFEYKQVSKTKDRQRVSPGARTTITIMQLQVRNHQEIIWVSHVPCRAIYSTASSKQEYMPESEKSGHSRSRRPKRPARMSCFCCCCASQWIDVVMMLCVHSVIEAGDLLACLHPAGRKSQHVKGPQNTLLLSVPSSRSSLRPVFSDLLSGSDGRCDSLIPLFQHLSQLTTRHKLTRIILGISSF